MKNIFYIDLQNIKTKSDLQKALIKELPLPSYYGQTLDSLHDILTESADNRTLIIYNCKDLSENEPKYFKSLIKMLTHASAETPNLKVKIFP